MARTPSLWKFREGWGDIINQEHSTKQTLIFELVPWNLKICGFLTFRLFEFCCHFSTFRTFRLLLPLFDFSDFSTFRVLLPLFDFSDFSTFAATFRLFGLFDFSSFAPTFRLFDFSTFRVFFHSSHLRPWMHPGSPTVFPLQCQPHNALVVLRQNDLSSCKEAGSKMHAYWGEAW